MAEPIQHDFSSKASTAGWEAAKGGVLGIVATGLIAAGALVLGAGLVGGFIGTIAPASAGIGFASWAGALLSGTGAYVTAAAGIAAAVAYAPIAAAVGATAGLMKGGNKINRESQAYHNLAQGRTQLKETELGQAQMAGMQQGYAAGFQQGAQKVVAELRAAQEQMLIEQQMGKAQGHADKFKKAESKAQTVTQSREAQATGPQIG